MIGVVALWNRLRSPVRRKARRRLRSPELRFERYGMDMLEKRQMLAVAPASDFTYATANDQVAITAYVGSASAVEIPATINSLPVTSIGDNAFEGKDLTSVMLPSGVTTIGYNAFYNCRSLTSISLPSGVTDIGGFAFNMCTSLTTVSIPTSVARMGDNPFVSCVSLTAISVSPDSVAFSSRDGVLYTKDGTALISYPAGRQGGFAIPTGVTSVGNSAFRDSGGLTSVTIPDSVTYLGQAVFWNCGGLTSIFIPDSVSSTNTSVLGMCENLRSARLSNSLTTLQGGFFADCQKLTDVIIPSSVTAVGDGAFKNCRSLVSIAIPSGVTDIYWEALRGCSSLTTVLMHGSPPTLGEVVFDGVDPTQATVYYPAGVSGWTNTYGGLPTKPYGVPEVPTAVTGVRGNGQVQLSWSAPASNVGVPVTDYSIQYSSDSGSSWQTFSHAASVATSATVTGLTNGTGYLFRVASVNDVGTGPYSTNSSAVTPQSDFTYATGNGQITITGYTGSSPAVGIPATIDGLPVTVIADNAFFNLAWITSISIPSGVEHIGFGSFAGTGITTLHLPASVTYFSSATYACFDLATITVDPASDAFVSIDGILYDKQVQTLIRCPSAREQAVTIPDTVTAIGYAAFIHCSKLTTIIGLQPTASIGWDAFSYCNNLRYLLEPSATTAPGDYLTYTIQSNYVDGIIITGFGGTGVGVVIPDSILDRPVVGIGSDAFNGRRSLESIRIPDSVTGIGNAAFANCNSLKSIAIPSGVTYIGFDAFHFCTSLTSITLPKSLAFLGGHDFYGATNLVSIDIDPSNEYLASIDGVLYDKALTAILECPKSKAGTVILPASVTAIGTAFVNCTRLSRIVIPEGVTTIYAGAFENCPAVLETTGASPFAPGKPSSIRGNGQVQLSWTAPVSNGGSAVTNYTIQYSSNSGVSWQTFTDAASSATSATVTGLTNGTGYLFRVASVNDVGTGLYSANSSAVTPATTPGLPTAVAGVRGNGQVQLSWTAPVSNGGLSVTDYTIQYSSNSGSSWQTFTDAVSAATSATVTGLNNGTGYLFRVASVNDVGTGLYSANSSAVTPATTPGAPTAVVGIRSFSQVQLSWTAPVSDGGLPVKDYTVQYSDDGSSWQTFSRVASTAPSVTVTGLRNGTGYLFRVASVNDVNPGLFSPTSSSITPNAVPLPPTNIVATRGKGIVIVSWTAPVSTVGVRVTDYRVQQSTNGGLSWVTVRDGVSVNTRTVVSGLVMGRDYIFRVAPVGRFGAGDSSSSSRVVVPATVPSVPVGLLATGGTAQVVLSWRAPTSTGGSPINQYVIQYSPSAGRWLTSTTVGSNTTTASVRGLLANRSYSFRVLALNEMGTSPASRVVVARTLRPALVRG